MPPRDAWRIVQKQGLISYWTGNYVTPATNRYLAASGPLQPRRSAQVPYRADEAQPHYEPVVPYRPREDRYAAEKASEEKPEPEPAPKSQKNVAKSRGDKGANRDGNRTLASSATPKFSMESLPYGTPVAGRPGMVMSPFATKEQLVDVTGMAAGDPVKCPYSGKLFRVPPTQQAASGAATSKGSEKLSEPPPSPPPPLHLSPSAPATSTPPPEPEPKSEPAPQKS